MEFIILSTILMVAGVVGIVVLSRLTDEKDNTKTATS